MIGKLYLVSHLVADVLLHLDDRVLGQGILVHQMVQLEKTVTQEVQPWLRCYYLVLDSLARRDHEPPPYIHLTYPKHYLSGKHGKAVAVFTIVQQDAKSINVDSRH